MNLRWLLFDYIDPEIPLTRRQRWKIALAPSGQSANRTRSNAAAIGGSFLGPFGLIGMIIWLVSKNLPPMFFLAGILFAVLILWVWQAFLCRVFMAPHYRAAARNHGFEICTSCGYSLRGLNDDVGMCPECGAMREPMPSGAQDRNSDG